MDFEWDPKKARSNQAKHGVSFEEATQVFGDEYALELYDNSEGEERFVIIGRVGIAVLVVVYTERNARIRIISARRATAREEEAYYEQAS